MSQESRSVRPIFIVGCPRSGTTLLQAMLTTHPQIISFPETHFFDYLKNPNKWMHRLGLSNRRSVELFLNNFIKQNFSSENENISKIYGYTYKYHIKQFEVLLNSIAKVNNAEAWVEKTPNHLHFVRLIEKYFNEPFIIHMIRNGFDTVSSLYKATNQYPNSWSGKRGLDRCINRWRHDVSMQTGFINRKNHYMVFYEDIISDKNEFVLKDLCDFLGITFYTEMITDYHQSFDQIVNEEEHYKLNVKRPLNEKVETSAVKLREDQQERIRERVSDIDLGIFKGHNHN